MRVAASTKKRIAEAKAEATEARHKLELLLAALEEHPGTKQVTKPLRDVVSRLAAWQRGG